MAQVIAKCRLTGHYMFMGIDLSADDFAGLPDPFARKFCPFCCCEHAWHKRDSKFLKDRVAVKQGVQQAS